MGEGGADAFAAEDADADSETACHPDSPFALPTTGAGSMAVLAAGATYAQLPPAVLSAVAGISTKLF